jgi:hypothetical protein
MEGMAKMGKSLTTMEGDFGLMGMLGAEKLYAQFKSAPETLSKGLRERFEKRSGAIEGAPDIMKRQYIMETAGGTSEMLRASIKELRDRMSGNVDQMAAQLQKTTGGSAFTARTLAEAAVGKEGDLDKALKEYEESNKTEAQKQLDKAEELTKQAAKTNDIVASIAKTVNSIHKWLIGMAIGSPLAAGLGGLVVGKLGGMITGKLAAMAAAKAAGGAAVTSAASSTAAGTIGATAAGGGLFTSAGALAALKTAAAVAAPVAVGAALAYGTYKIAQGYKAAHAGDAEDEATGRRARGSARWQNKVLNAVGIKSNEYELDTFVMNMSFKELDAKKAKIKQLTTEIETMKKTGKDMTAADRDILEAKQKKLAAEKRSISAIVAEEERAFAESKAGLPGRLAAGVMKNVYEGADKVAQKLNKSGKGAGSLKDLAFDFVSDMGSNIIGHSSFNRSTADFLEGDSPQAKQLKAALAKAGIGEKDFARAVSDRASFVQMGGKSSGLTENDFDNRQKMAEAWGKSGRGAAETIVPFSESERAAMNKGTALNIAIASGEGQGDVVTPVRDASDNITIQMPGQKLVLNGGELSNQVSDISGRNGAKG